MRSPAFVLECAAISFLLLSGRSTAEETASSERREVLVMSGRVASNDALASDARFLDSLAGSDHLTQRLGDGHFLPALLRDYAERDLQRPRYVAWFASSALPLKWSYADVFDVVHIVPVEVPDTGNDSGPDGSPATTEGVPTVTKLSEHLYSIELAGSDSLYLYRAEKHAFVSKTRSRVDPPSAELHQLVNAEWGHQDISLRLHIDQVPMSWRLLLTSIVSELDFNDPPLPMNLQCLFRTLQSIVTDVRSIELTVDVSDTTRDAACELTIRTIEGSPMDVGIAELCTRQSRVAHLTAEDDELSVLVSCPRVAVLRSLLKFMEPEYKREWPTALRAQKFSDNPFDDPLADYERAVQHTIDAVVDDGDIDVLMRIPASGGRHGVCFAASVPDEGMEIESQVVRLASAIRADSPAFGAVTANVTTVGQLPVHRSQFAEPKADGSAAYSYLAMTSEVLLIGGDESGREWVVDALCRSADAGLTSHCVRIAGRIGCAAELIEPLLGPGGRTRAIVRSLGDQGRFAVTVEPDRHALRAVLRVDEALLQSLVRLVPGERAEERN